MTDIVKRLEFDNIRLICNNVTSGKDVIKVAQKILPSPSLNEVIYLAFGDISEEYHNELDTVSKSVSQLSCKKGPAKFGQS